MKNLKEVNDKLTQEFETLNKKQMLKIKGGSETPTTKTEIAFDESGPYLKGC